MKIAAVLPAYNEASRIADVVRSVCMAPSIAEVIVVNDGSTDDTAARVRAVGGAVLLSLPHNQGKGGAMAAGADATDADVLVFLDADLRGLRPEHVEALVAPVKTGRVAMAVGKFHGGRRITDWSQRLAPSISGQRAIKRAVFEQIPAIACARFGVEMAITRFCRHYRVPTETVVLRGVTHPMKEEKLGFVRGWSARGRMYTEILRIMLDPRAPRRAEVTVPRLLKRLCLSHLRDRPERERLLTSLRAARDEWRRRDPP